MGYFTIKNNAMAEFDEKKSIFIGHVKRVESENDAKAFIDEIRGQYKDARHNVYAYIIGENMGIQRYSDDGEPKGTAGIPVLEVMKKNEITDSVVVVTRYFGGILLGAGGLARAYSKGAAMAIKEAMIVEKVRGIALEAIIDYDLLGKVQYLCGQNQWHIEDTAYTEAVSLKIYSESSIIDEVERAFVEATSGKVTLLRDDEKYYFKLDGRLYEA